MDVYTRFSNEDVVPVSLKEAWPPTLKPGEATPYLNSSLVICDVAYLVKRNSFFFGNTAGIFESAGWQTKRNPISLNRNAFIQLACSSSVQDLRLKMN